MPITLNHSNIGVQYSTGSNYIIETVKSDLYRRNEIYDNIVRDNIQVAPVTPSLYIENGTNNVYAVESYTYSGTANTADFTRVFPKSTTCDILIVGGGGGGGKRHGAGGGAGTLMYHKNIILNGTYNIKVGKGGTGHPSTTSTTTSTATDGNFSQFVKSDGTQNYYAVGGGRGTTGGNFYANTNGGQGYLYDANLTLSSGNIFNSVAVAVSNKEYVNTLTSPEGCRGRIGGTQINNYKGGGGGGAGGVGMNHAEETTVNDGYGGLGLAIDITGTSVVYAGGGNGADFNGTVLTQVFDPAYSTIQSRGGGGFGSDTGTAQNGLDGTGGGGGGQGNDTAGNLGGNGGSGIVIIRYLLGTIPANNLLTNANEPIITSPTFTETIRTFVHSGGAETQTTHTITLGRDTICDILIVGGGGAGGKDIGAGGGGGAVLYGANISIAAGTYIIKVGRGGTPGEVRGQSSEAFGATLLGGGCAGNVAWGINTTANSGGSGSGGKAYWGVGSSASTLVAGGVGISTNGIILTTATLYNGNVGGTAIQQVGGNPIQSAGGGGAGAVGGNGNGSGTKTGNGGAGVLVNITGVNYYWGGGGGGGGYQSTPTDGGRGGGGAGERNDGQGSLGFGTGGADAYNAPVNMNGGAGSGGGGGGSGYTTTTAGNGGSGIVIIKLKSTTPILEGITHKRLNFFYEQPSIIYNFTPYNDLASWTAYATSIGATYVLPYYDTATDAVWNPAAAEGYISLPLNNNYNYLTVTFGNVLSTYNVFLRINGITKETCTGGQTKTYSQSYNTGDVLTILEDGTGINANLVIILSRTNTVTNQYTLNFPVPTIADINNNSNIVLRGAYDLSLSTSNAVIIPKTGQYIPKPTTFATDLLSIRYNILNPLNDPIGAQLTYSSNNTNVYHMGSVGIGTTSPEYQLDVSGSVNAKSYYLNGRQINEPLSELGLSEGMIAQVRHLTYTQMDVKNNTGWDAINDNLTTGFVIAITPKSNLSKILLNIIVHIGLAATSYSVWWGIKLYRKIGTDGWTEVTGPNGTETGSAAATAGTPVWISNTMYAGDLDYTYKVTNVTGTYLDSPNTTSTVYYTAYWNNKIGDNPSAINTIYLNRAENHGDAYRPAPSSSWTASEIWYG